MPGGSGRGPVRADHARPCGYLGTTVGGGDAGAPHGMPRKDSGERTQVLALYQVRTATQLFYTLQRTLSAE